MTFQDVATLLDAEILTKKVCRTTEATTAFASDLMSDVLAFSANSSILITGLCNSQIIRTAEMMDVSCIILARGKKADAEMVELAEDCNVCLMQTEMFVFSICAELAAKGITGGGKNA